MKRLSTALVAAGAALVLGATPAQAQSGLSFGAGGGLTLPLGDFGDVAKLGWHGLATVGYSPASGQIGFRGDFFYGQNSIDEDAVGVGGKFKIAAGIGSIVYSFQSGGSLRPYVLGSIGYFNSKGEPDTGPSSSSNDVGFGGGIGANFKAGSDANLFVEGRYLNVDGDGFIPVTIGLRFFTK